MFTKSIFLVFFTISASSSLYLECTYSMRTHWTVPNIYTCTARIIAVGDPRIVTDVSRNHLAGRNNSDVRGLSFRNQGITELPTNIAEFFPNVEAIDTTNTLERITREDLEVFPRLRELHLNNNNVRIIETNLFAGNPNMSAISFISNPVAHVAHGVFDNLTQLTQLRFDAVACHSQAAVNRAGVLNLIGRLAVMCPPTFDMNFEMIEERLLNGLNFKTTVDEQISVRINPITYSLFQVNERLAEVERQLNSLKKEVQNLTLVKDFLKANQGQVVRI